VPHHQATCRRCTKIKGKKITFDNSQENKWQSKYSRNVFPFKYEQKLAMRRKFRLRNEAKGILRDLEDIKRNMNGQR
jgi:hypothetical protein